MLYFVAINKLNSIKNAVLVEIQHLFFIGGLFIYEIYYELFSRDVLKLRKEKKLSQIELSEKTEINRVLIGKLEKMEFIPSIIQCEKICDALNINLVDYFKEKETKKVISAPINIAVAGTGYVGLSLAILLAQHNNVTAVDVIQDKVDKINNKISPIQDEYIEKYLKDRKSVV